MHIAPSTSIHDLVTEHPYLIDVLADFAPAFAKLKNPLLRNTLGRVATLQQAADIAGLEVNGLMLHIARGVLDHSTEAVTIVPKGAPGTGAKPGPQAGASPCATTCGTPCDAGQALEGSTPPLTDAARMDTLKELIRELHAGADPASLKARFAAAVGDISGGDIARLEQAMVAEGLPEAEIKRLCSLHVDLFKGALDEAPAVSAPAGHPVRTYMDENAKAMELADEIISQVDRMHRTPGDRTSPIDEMAWSFSSRYVQELLEDLARIEVHYTRKENQLFPLLEENGIEAPPKVMWEVHDDIRALFKAARAAMENLAATGSALAAREAAEAVKDMIYKEEKVLFPMALESLTEAQWARVRHGEDEIGYAWVTPGGEWTPQAAALAGLTDTAGTAGQARTSGSARLVQLDTGALAPNVLNQMLRSLPVDLNFVDADDRVAYYSDVPHRIFPRSAAVIGRNVRNCHPPKSVHMVEDILTKFKTGERDTAEFWIELGGRFLHIRYFAVRDTDSAYLGCLEVSQDVTDIRALSGQRRLLEWS
ncbi:DUF438 domain-containing protein [Nitratidesulfovibrio sp. HK-II]|uniref:DUF438 domain-containing protein n=1 Tax=Nitratidesulfovibrio sp. HK-II TaxID=2009266 RepID=UPI000E2F9106|nr:DUF438 domain-containing protein [Nitratidesulfovibrio sp. HK-II]GBO95302.1 hypothetical protein RVX_0343 [Nitratidesulfovibrio sp. HK-II]